MASFHETIAYPNLFKSQKMLVNVLFVFYVQFHLINTEKTNDHVQYLILIRKINEIIRLNPTQSG